MTWLFSVTGLFAGKTRHTGGSFVQDSPLRNISDAVRGGSPRRCITVSHAGTEWGDLEGLRWISSRHRHLFASALGFATSLPIINTVAGLAFISGELSSTATATATIRICYPAKPTPPGHVVTLGARSPRRTFLLRGGVLVASAIAGRNTARATTWAVRDRPLVSHGISIGDVTADRALVWARSDRPSRMHVAWDTSAAFTAPRHLHGGLALPASDYTSRLELRDLPADREIFIRVSFESLESSRAQSEPVLGSFRAAPERRDLRVVWSGDTAGQGYGINQDIGGMRGYESMRVRRPDLFIHCGDTIYADGPLTSEVSVEDGKRWRNIVTPEKSKVAETLHEFRGNFRYNLLDDNVKRFNAQVPQLWLWDDHEVCNNWSSSKDLSTTSAYVEKNIAVLAARARRAFLEYAPAKLYPDGDTDRVYRRVPYGPLLDVFTLDMRAYRGPNSHNLQAARSRDSDFLGRSQLRWLQQSLKASRARWKLIAADMPLGLVVPDGSDAGGRTRFDGISNGDGPARGRELELAELLRFIKHEHVRNVVWVTADVHYTAAHYYDPAQASFADFEPFWEFVSGPINAGAFGPNEPDTTFGLRVVYQKTPPRSNLSPLSDYQFFGEINIDARDETLTVTLRDVAGKALFERALAPHA